MGQNIWTGIGVSKGAGAGGPAPNRAEVYKIACSFREIVPKDCQDIFR